MARTRRRISPVATSSASPPSCRTSTAACSTSADLPNGNMYKLKDGVSNPLDLQRNQTRAPRSTDGSDFLNIRNNLDPLAERYLAARPRRLGPVGALPRGGRSGAPLRLWHTLVAFQKPRLVFSRGQCGHPARAAAHRPPRPRRQLVEGLPRQPQLHRQQHRHRLPMGCHLRRYPPPARAARRRADFTRDYRNFIREFRQLLWQEETVETHDRRPRRACSSSSRSPTATAGRAARRRQGTEAMTADREHRRADEEHGLRQRHDVRLESVGGRGAFLDQIAAEPAIPNQPDDHLQRHGWLSRWRTCSSPVPRILIRRATGTFGKMQWRIAEVTATGAGGETEILAAGSNWKFLDDGSDQGADWRQPGFDDSPGLAARPRPDTDSITNTTIETPIEFRSGLE